MVESYVALAGESKGNRGETKRARAPLRRGTVKRRANRPRVGESPPRREA
jgi:hypothetical protein